jgi:hypothetical protein
MKYSISYGVFAGVLALAVGSADAVPIFQLDGGGGPVQSGWTQVTSSNRFDNSTYLDLGGGVTAGVGDWGAGGNDRGDAGVMAGLGLDDMLRDYLQLGNSNFDDTFYIRGLADGDYILRIYSLDSDYDYEVNTFDVNGTEYSSGPAQGNGGDLTYTYVDVPVTLSNGAASNEIVIGKVDFGKISGIELSEAVPEPATLALLGIGGILAVAARRQRR